MTARLTICILVAHCSLLPRIGHAQQQQHKLDTGVPFDLAGCSASATEKARRESEVARKTYVLSKPKPGTATLARESDTDSNPRLTSALAAVSKRQTAALQACQQKNIQREMVREESIASQLAKQHEQNLAVMNGQTSDMSATATSSAQTGSYRGEGEGFVRLLLSHAGTYSCTPVKPPPTPTRLACQRDGQVAKALQLAWAVECSAETGEAAQAAKFAGVMMDTLHSASSLCSDSNIQNASCDTEAILSCTEMPR